MNIYFTGAHGCGKTTVAKIIKERTEFSTLPSVARHSPYKPGTIENQKYVMDKVFCRATKYDGVILERTPLDVYSYTKMLDMEEEYGRQEMKVEAFFRGIEYSGQPVFYFPICFELQNDGVRPGKWEQIEIDSYIRGYLKKNDINHYVIPDTTPEKRVEFILERVVQGACL